MKWAAEYEGHLSWIDGLTSDVLRHTPPTSPDNDLFRADLAGLLCVSYAAAFENCIKAIFTSFASSKHRILGNVASFHFEKINSKIHWQTIGDVHAAQFGTVYRKKYFELLDDAENEFLQQNRVSLKETYSNLLKWRHAFAHEGKKLASLEEAVAALPLSKKVIFVLDSAMSI
jgi:hypothetical protein